MTAPEHLHDSADLVEILRFRSSQQPERRAYSFLHAGDEAGTGLGESLTYRELDRRAAALAATLARHAAPGDRALLLFPPGLDFVSAFFGCLYAGVVAVPAYPPRLNRSSERLAAIVGDSAAAVVLTTEAIADRFRGRLAHEGRLGRIPWVAADGEGAVSGEPREIYRPEPSDLAFLQYTSGSTALPKGVEIRHSNLLHNEEMMRRAFGQGPDSVIVGWLPLYHDMGLIGNVLQPLYVGAPCVLMAPLTFLQRPRRWLEVITEHRGTTSGGPNFAYDLCVQKVAEDDLAGLDLSSWRVAFNGAEPVRPETMDAFAERFAPCGFRREAFFPCYGLAEGTLFVTGVGVGQGATSGAFQEQALEDSRAVAADVGDGGRRLAGSGRPWSGQEVVIAHPETGKRLAEGEIGEVWARGPSIALAYWNQPEATAETFGASLAGEEGSGPFLRTGDLGFLQDGELFVTGRLKDLIILRGRNLYPHDVERTVEEAHPDLRPGCGAAFSVDVEGSERLVVAQEVERRSRAPVEVVASAVRARVAAEHEAQVYEVVLLRVGTVPRTSSGKIRRLACRQGYLEGSLNVVGRSRLEVVSAAGGKAAARGAGLGADPWSAQDLDALPREERLAYLLSLLQAEAAAVLGRPPEPGQSLLELGLDSVAAVDLQTRWLAVAGESPSAADLLGGATLEEAAELALGAYESAGEAPEEERLLAEVDDATEGAAGGDLDLPASDGQRSFWLQTALSPESGALNVCAAATVVEAGGGAVDGGALEAAFRALARRHPALRTTFRESKEGAAAEAGGLLQRVHEDLGPDFQALDAADPDAWSEESLEEEIAREADRPFDLRRGPLLRLRLYRRRSGEGDVLLLVLHHAVTDLWSMGVLLRELGPLYDAARSGTDAERALPPFRGWTPGQAVLRQRRRLQGAQGEALRAYWHGRLSGPPPPLSLLPDRPRPALRTFAGRRVHGALGGDLGQRVEAATRAAGVTPFMLLLAAFQTLLHRWAGQDDLVLGSPAAGREVPELRETVGYLVNMVPLRSRLLPGTTFEEMTAATRQTVLEALAHQDYPFPRLVEELRAGRDPSRPAIFQGAFVLQGALGPGGAALGAFSGGHPGVDLATGSLEMRSRPVEVRSCQFELTLTVAPVPEGLALSLLFNSDLFEEETAQRLLASYGALLERALEEPAAEMESLSLLSPAQERQILTWARPKRSHPVEGTLAERFSAVAARRPREPALRWQGETTTYGELEERANRLARFLRRRGVARGSRVGLCEERRPELVVGALAILKAGGGYVPLDPALPRERLAFLAGDAGLEAVVTRSELLPSLPEAVAGAAGTVCTDREAEAIAELDPSPPASATTAEDFAYMIYTSGSTGKPKGVVVSHGNVLRLLDATEGVFSFGPDDVWTLFHSFSFDFSVWELWGPLLSGGRLVVVPYEVSRSPEAFLRLLEDEGVTVLNQTPSAFRALTAVPGALDEDSLPRLRWVIFGGEALELGLLRPWLDRRKEGRPGFVNMYGITETTVHVTHRPITRLDLEAQRGSVVGEAIEDMSLVLLDRRGRPVAPGMVGEIHVGGAGLAQGYHGRPALTAERFVPDPFSGVAGSRLYRSGDLARFRASGGSEGDLEHLGRSDHQVKIRGFRIEVGEIESALSAHPGVDGAVVVTAATEGGPPAGESQMLVAYVRASSEGGPVEVPAPADLRSWLLKSLPDYMIPSLFVPVEDFPLTANGKLDRSALPDPHEAAVGSPGKTAAPLTETEKILTEVWARALEVEKVGADDNYFALGGDSIRSLRLQTYARERGLEVGFQDLFRFQTVRELAKAVEAAGGVQGREPGAAVPPFSLVAEEDRSRLPEGLDDAYPLTRLMAGMIYQSNVTADYEVYVTSLHLKGRFDEGALRQALGELARGHEILRTAFDAAGFTEPLQLVYPEAEIPLEVVDLRSRSTEEQEPLLQEWLEGERRRRFPWNEAPLIRFTAHRRGEGSFQLTMSEPFFDGWSVASLLTELFRRYTAILGGGALPVTRLAAGMRDFVALEQEAVESEEHRAYWRSVVAGAEAGTIARWPGRQATEEERKEAARRLPVPITPARSEALSALADGLGVPLKAVLLAAHGRAMAVAGGRRDALTGMLWNGRPEIPDGDRVLGAFLNAICFRVEAESGTWKDLVRRSFEAEQALVPYRRMPLAEVQRERDGAPLFDSLFNFTHFHVYRQLDALPGVEVLEAFASDQTYFDLTAQFNVDHGTGHLRLFLDYRPGGFGSAQMTALGDLYGRILTALAERPEDAVAATALLSDGARHQLLHEWSGPGRLAIPSPVHTLHEAVEEQVSRRPEAVALVEGERSWTFRQLEEQANRLARWLIAQGVGPEERVAVCLERSLEATACLLGILKAGAAYLPLAVGEPPARRRWLLEDAGARFLLADDSELPKADEELPPGLRCRTPAQAFAEAEAWPPASPAVRVQPESLAWVIYTSGSTGRPKGVASPHRVTLERLRWYWKQVPPAEDEVCCQKSVLSSVDAVIEVFGPLLAGVPAVVVPDSVAKDHDRFLELLEERKVTRLALVPSLLGVMAEAEGGLARRASTVRSWISSGEALPTALARRFKEELPEALLWNLCGSTEASSAVYQVVDEALLERSSGRVPVGRARPGCRVHVVDRRLRPAPLAVHGEMCVGGPVKARGYLGRPALTAERFVPDPWSEEPGRRLYRTGDLARFRPDGTLDVLGRIDGQVQIRGFRVETGEVEAAVAAHPAVARAAVKVWQDTGEPRLVAYVVREPGEGSEAGGDGTLHPELRTFLRQRLPEHMVPSAFVTLEALPLLPAGKVDRRALPAPPAEGAALRGSYVPPRNASEEVIAGVWADVLGLERVGIEDDFYELGGHSLLATQVISRLRRLLELELPLRQLFETPTVAGLASSLPLYRGLPPVPPLEPVDRDGELPLSFAQQRLCFLDRLSPGDPVYNVPGAVSLRGPLDPRALETALEDVAARHEALRTTFVTAGGKSRQRIAPELAVPLPVIDLAELDEQARRLEAWSLVAREARRPFDLAEGPLVRAVLLHFGSEEHWFLPTLHHVVSDGWSHGIFVRELVTAYEARARQEEPDLPPLRVQYADFAAWQRRWLQGEVLDRQVDYWRSQLGESLPVLVLPTDHPRPRNLGSAGSRVRTRIPAPQLEAVKDLSLREGTSLFMTLLAAFEVVLHARSKQTDLVVGTDVANRNLAETEAMIGFFVNQLVLRLDLSQDPSFRQILGRVRKVSLDAYAHQDLPFEKLVEVLNPPRESNRTPLFQVKFVLQNVPREALSVAGLEVERLELDDGTAKFDLLFNLWENAGALDGALEYRSELFEHGTVQHLVEDFQLVLGAVVEHPDLPLGALRERLEEEEARRRKAQQDQWRKASQSRFKRRRPKSVPISRGSA